MRKHAPFSAIATCFLFTFVHAAGACSLSDRQITVNFDEGSAGLGARNARALAEWFIQWRDGLGIESIIAAAPAVKHRRQLAEERLRHVTRLLHGLNTGNAPISYEVERETSRVFRQKLLEFPRRECADGLYFVGHLLQKRKSLNRDCLFRHFYIRSFRPR